MQIGFCLELIMLYNKKSSKSLIYYVFEKIPSYFDTLSKNLALPYDWSVSSLDFCILLPLPKWPNMLNYPSRKTKTKVFPSRKKTRVLICSYTKYILRRATFQEDSTKSLKKKEKKKKKTQNAKHKTKQNKINKESVGLLTWGSFKI